MGMTTDLVYMTRAELGASVKFAPAKELSEAGKILRLCSPAVYLRAIQGRHVIDNSDPPDPRVTDYIEVLGCVDITVQNNILYADNAVDFVAVDLVGARG
jgi:hypothetical protein